MTAIGAGNPAGDNRPHRLRGRCWRWGVMFNVFACADPGAAPTAHAPTRQRTDPLVWAGEQKLVASDGAELDEFGYAVSLDDGRALIGAYGEGEFTGAAYVFARSGRVWSEEQKLLAGDSEVGDDFGRAVSLYGDRALVGASGRGYYVGAGYVFAFDGQAWKQEQVLTASDAGDLDQLGWSASLTADRALLGAYGHDAERGAAYVFARSGQRWIQEQKLLASDGAAGDHLGYSVALGDTVALVGAPADDDYRGAVYAFGYESAGWTEQRKLVVDDGAEFSQFGAALAVWGNRALVGAHWADEFVGAAYLFSRSDEGWALEQKLTATSQTAGERFGGSVSLGAERVLIGASAAEDNRGAAYVFSHDGARWRQEQRLAASDGVGFDLFGLSVSLAGEAALVGANYSDQLRGAAYVFSLGLANGDACSDADQCASGYCVDQVCCDGMCGACGVCSTARGASADGTCTVVPAGSQGEPSCAPLTCDGYSATCESCRHDVACRTDHYCAADGTCRPSKALGEACNLAEVGDCATPGCRVCQTGYCVDGVCCDRACDGVCEACLDDRVAEIGAIGDGICRPIAAGRDPDAECSDDGTPSCVQNGYCDGSGACQQYPHRTSCAPQACRSGDACTSGFCEDGICCDRVCGPDERCRAELKVAGEDGVCGPALAARIGAACRFDVQCSSGHCVFGVCCASPCAGPCGSCGADAPPPDGNQTELGGGAGCAFEIRERPHGRGWLALAIGILALFKGRRLRRATGYPDRTWSGSKRRSPREVP